MANSRFINDTLSRKRKTFDGKDDLSEVDETAKFNESVLTEEDYNSVFGEKIPFNVTMKDCASWDDLAGHAESNAMPAVSNDSAASSSSSSASSNENIAKVMAILEKFNLKGVLAEERKKYRPNATKQGKIKYRDFCNTSLGLVQEFEKYLIELTIEGQDLEKIRAFLTILVEKIKSPTEFPGRFFARVGRQAQSSQDVLQRKHNKDHFMNLFRACSLEHIRSLVEFLFSNEIFNFSSCFSFMNNVVHIENPVILSAHSSSASSNSSSSSSSFFNSPLPASTIVLTITDEFSEIQKILQNNGHAPKEILIKTFMSYFIDLAKDSQNEEKIILFLNELKNKILNLPISPSMFFEIWGTEISILNKNRFDYVNHNKENFLYLFAGCSRENIKHLIDMMADTNLPNLQLAKMRSLISHRSR